MSKAYALTSAVVAATLAAIQKGATLESHAASVVASGFAPNVPAFVKAYNAKAEDAKVTASLAAVSLPPKSNAKAVKASALAVETHNKAHPSALRALAVKADGSFYLVSLPKTRAKGKAGKVGSSSNIGAGTVAESCSKADGYTFERCADGSYLLNGESVAKGKLMPELRKLADTCPATKAKLTAYGKL